MQQLKEKKQPTYPCFHPPGFMCQKLWEKKNSKYCKKVGKLMYRCDVNRIQQIKNDGNHGNHIYI